VRERVAVPVTDGEGVDASHLARASQAQGDQADTPQSTGHESYVHGCASCSAGHALPPLAGWAVTARVR
jgi:hypothetical protein